MDFHPGYQYLVSFTTWLYSIVMSSILSWISHKATEYSVALMAYLVYGILPPAPDPFLR
jgi:hypothetical protein